MAKGSGLNKEVRCSKELEAVVKHHKIARKKIMGAIWKYAKRKGLQSENDGRIINCDSRLAAIFKRAIKEKRVIVSRGKKIKVPKGSIFMTEIAGQIAKHVG